MIRNLAWVLFAVLAEPWLCRPRPQPWRQFKPIVVSSSLDGRELARAVHRHAKEAKS